jgi:mono/diheme cytochrome c family protein
LTNDNSNHESIELMRHCALVLTACFINSAGAAAGPEIDLNDPDHIAAGHRAFNTNCTQYCHGQDGRIGRGPELRNRKDLGADEIYSIITNGKSEPAKVMPAWKGQLDETMIWQITAYILSLRNAK